MACAFGMTGALDRPTIASNHQQVLAADHSGDVRNPVLKAKECAMLVLSRKQQQQIKIGEQITVTILRVSGSTVRVGIQAPRDVRVIRGELPKEDASQAEHTAASAVQDGTVEIGTVEIGTAEIGTAEIGTAEIGAIELVVGSDEPSEALDETLDETLDEAVAELGGEHHQPVVIRSALAPARRSSALGISRGPLAHLVAGSVALAK
jgi:carbon storage regulator CsrA